MARKAPSRDKDDPYTGNAVKDGYTCLARRASLDDLLHDKRDEYARAFEELGEYRGRGRPLRSAPFKDEDDGGYFY